MYDSTNWPAITGAIVVVRAIICAIACGFIATAGNRDAGGYAMAAEHKADVSLVRRRDNRDLVHLQVRDGLMVPGLAIARRCLR